MRKLVHLLLLEFAKLNIKKKEKECVTPTIQIKNGKENENEEEQQMPADLIDGFIRLLLPKKKKTTNANTQSFIAFAYAPQNVPIVLNHFWSVTGSIAICYSLVLYLLIISFAQHSSNFLTDYASISISFAAKN